MEAKNFRGSIMKYHHHTILILILLLLTLTACRPGIVSSQTPVPVKSTIEISLSPQVTSSNLPVQAATEESAPTVRAPLFSDNEFTEENPLVDPVKIQEILEQLQQYQLDWFSNIGWMHYVLIMADASDFTRTEHFWTYVSDRSLGCREQFVYFEHEGEILPFTLRLEDGKTARIEPLSGDIKTEFYFKNAPVCTLNSMWIVTFREEESDTDYFIHDRVAQFQKFLELDEPGLEKYFWAWVEELDGRQVFVIRYEYDYDYAVYNYTSPSTRAGMLYDPRAGILYVPAKEVLWVYIDLEKGLSVRERGIFYDQNGQELNHSLSGTNNGIQFIYEYYEEMPSSVAQAYEQSIEKLKIFLQEN